MSFDRKLLEVLVCPVSKTKLVYDADNSELISTAANLAFPVRDGIAVLLENEARQITAEEAEKFREIKS